jgi:hypothetical protein
MEDLTAMKLSIFARRLIDFLSLVAIAVAVQQMISLFFTMPAGYEALIAVVTFIVLLISHAGVPMDSPFLRRLWRTLVFVPKNIWLWIFGNLKEHELLGDIHTTALALHESILFGQLANLKNAGIGQYYIVHTHKGEHDPIVGNGEGYRIPGFPFDEAELIMRLWYFVASNLNLDWSHIRTACGCSFANRQFKERIYRGSFAVVGSPKANSFSKDLMDKIGRLEEENRLERKHMYIMQVDGDLCFLRGRKPGDRDLRPDPTNPLAPDTEKVMTDYAVMMKLPNIVSCDKIDRGHTILLFAGCKVAGQVALTVWISQPENLAHVTSSFSSKYFYIILEVKYRFVPQGVPKLILVKPCLDSQGQAIEGEIKL